MAWRNVISKNTQTEREPQKLVSTKRSKTLSSGVSIACSSEGNDKCKLIAWFVLLFDSEMMSRAGMGDSAAVIVRLYKSLWSFSHYRFRVVLLSEVLHVNDMRLSSAVAFLASFFLRAALEQWENRWAKQSKQSTSQFDYRRVFQASRSCDVVFDSRTFCCLLFNIRNLRREFYGRDSHICDENKRINKIIKKWLSSLAFNPFLGRQRTHIVLSVSFKLIIRDSKHAY